MRATGAIGLYDSGVGGLTVVREVCNQLPQESVVYVGDTARVPYGGRSAAEILRFGREIGAYLTDQGVKVILVACNTSSALALEQLAAEISVPLVGVLNAGAGAAARASSTGRIGVIATEATVRSGAYERAIRTFRPEAAVMQQGCPALVPLIEAGQTDGPEVRDALAEYLRPLLAAKVDTILYGCTHYPFLDRVVADLAGPDVARIDPAAALVGQAKELLRRHGALAAARTLPDRYIVSGSPERFRALGSLFLQRALPPVEQMDLEGYGVGELTARTLSLTKERGSE
ncbi:MAG: glutamate racemase [Bacteroidota bacterium]